jgi:hypothetical protein
VSQQRDQANAELRHISPRLVAAEQLVRAKEAEVEDLRRAYESLALEHRRCVMDTRLSIVYIGYYHWLHS